MIFHIIEYDFLFCSCADHIINHGDDLTGRNIVFVKEELHQNCKWCDELGQRILSRNNYNRK